MLMLFVMTNPQRRLSLLLSDMDNHAQTDRAAKRRRTGKGRRGIAEGDEITADGVLVRTVTHRTEQGLVQEVRSRPVWLNEEMQTPPGPEEVVDISDTTKYHDSNIPNTMPNFDSDIPNVPRTAKTQQYYLHEFVKRVHPMLTSLLGREVPEDTQCSQCADHQIARWRCQDCTSGSMLCRGCMRASHMCNPLHRIEAWTGTYFRRAELWQVGVYILVPHHAGERICASLRWNKRLLEGFQQTRDASEQAELSRGIPVRDRPNQASMDTENGEDEPHADKTVMDDWEFNQHLDDLYTQYHDSDLHPGTARDVLEEDDIGNEDDEPPLIAPTDYMPVPGKGMPPDAGPSRDDNMDTHMDTEVPRTDALDNPFVRVVHINGIHHISVVSCPCRGRESTHCDLMAACLVPTSFVRHRTMFTHAVLDDF